MAKHLMCIQSFRSAISKAYSTSLIGRSQASQTALDAGPAITPLGASDGSSPRRSRARMKSWSASGMARFYYERAERRHAYMYECQPRLPCVTMPPHMPDPATQIQNDRTNDGAFVCPDCQKPISLSMGARFRNGYLVHLGCPEDGTVR